MAVVKKKRKRERAEIAPSREIEIQAT